MELARRNDRDREPFALFVARFSLLRVRRSRSCSATSKEAAGIIFIEIDRRSIQRIAWKPPTEGETTTMSIFIPSLLINL